MAAVRGSRARSLCALVVGVGAANVFSCSGGDHASPTGNGGGGADSGLQFGASGNLGSVLFPDGSACAAEVRKGELAPVDLYVLLDKSGSMHDQTSSGITKWDAISTALRAFVQDPASAGLGVGLQYFPLLKAGVPESCTTNAECGTGGPCLLSACDNVTSPLQVCVTSRDCPRGGNCVHIGWCEYTDVGSGPIYCSPIGNACQPPYGNCIDIPDRPCVTGIDCSPARYATADVPIAALPGNAAALVASIAGTTPHGNTPTGPALGGAIQEAQTYATAHPGHTVAAVLATDGLPTECTPVDITSVAAIAAAGKAGNPSIPTFVIGVFAPGDVDSPANLQTIAEAGGTNQAFIVDTSQDVEAAFRKALDSIRGSALLPCEVAIPQTSNPAGLDFNRVNLQIIDASNHSTQLVSVSSASACGNAPGAGWYYDVQPSSSATPSKIQLCGDVCSAFRSEAGAVLSFQMGCATIIR